MKVLEIISLKYIIAYFLIINVISFLLFFIDKKLAIYSKKRIAEKTLIGTCLLGGSIGGIFSMYIFRHKTKKYRFSIGIPIIIIIQVILALYLIYVG